MSLVFEDTFQTFNTSTWRYDLGDGSIYGLEGFGNGEVQCYTNSANNLDLVPNPECPPDTDSLLRIRSGKLPNPQTCSNPGLQPSQRDWTSAKIDTKGKLLLQWKAPQVSSSLQEARSGASALQFDSQGQPIGPCSSVLVEARMKVPMSAGRWSAFWMMPQPQPGRFPGCQAWVPGEGECGAFGGWPRSGEIDIMEHVNADLKVLGTLHWGTQSGQQASEGGNKALSAEELQGWNVYQLRWSCDAIEWYVNGLRMHFVQRAWVQPQWPFDEPFFLIFNTAVGGALTGYADADARTAEMLVDYVRVYAS
ncbi:hypothetical protein OEZ85_000478 [Tetradesmus obliquus]|uniref:GH16 domain-containing protein n=1 Tax=Tetradesmus obliquus TaxID=3088 RepID=A0ABY8UJ17_TETOB|nr:hypothetical protein OEZ85_000478 [Tetradesmus obliquus]